ncbi:MAG TPA: DUF58 domain-containing protein [Mycobacterium sp.]
MTEAGETRHTDVELRWRPSSLTLSIATCGAAGLAAAVIGSSWQLIAFVAPLLGVLCSISWQPSIPVIRVHAGPASQRCFETEQAELKVWTSAQPDTTPVDLTVSVHPAMSLDSITDLPDSRKAVVVSAARWGRYPVRAAVEVGGRGGLLSGAATVDAADVTVFPLTPPQSTPIPPTELPDRLGTHLTRHFGRGVEYADIRPYVPGDPLRAVNWPVSARRRSLHVTQRLTERAADVVVLIDTYDQPRGPATQAVERTVRGAAQVVQAALRNGDRAGIVTLGGHSPRWLGTDIGQRQFYRVLDAVLGASYAGAGFETTTGTLAPRAAVPPGAVVVAFSTLLDTEFSFALIDLRRRGHVVLAVDVLPGSPFEVDPDPLIARMWALQRSAMYGDMATIGVDVAPWREDQPLEQSMRLVTDRRRLVWGR